MSDQAPHAPHAPQPNDTPATTTASTAEAPRPTSGPAAATNIPETGTAPATTPSATTFPPPQNTTTTTQEPQSLNEKLNNADRYWKFKGVFQVVTILSGLIGIGVVSWTVATDPREGFYFDYTSIWAIWPSLLTFALSVIWCAICLAVLVKSKKPVHPGLRVAMDLLFWLGFIATVMLAMFSYMDLSYWGEYGSIDVSWGSYNGDYQMADNGTWVWEYSSSSSITYARSCDNSPYYFFKSCAEQDAFVNKLWQDKPARVSAELTAVVCQFISLIAHLILFIWACVDCHRYRKSRTSQDAEKLAANIVQTMIENGAIIPPPGQARMRPIPWGQPGHYQLSSGQSYPMAVVYPQHAPVPQIGRAHV